MRVRISLGCTILGSSFKLACFSCGLSPAILMRGVTRQPSRLESFTSPSVDNMCAERDEVTMRVEKPKTLSEPRQEKHASADDG